MTLEQVVCALCDVDDTRHLVTKNALHVVQCRHCGLVYVNPRPSADALTEIYTDEGYCQVQVDAAEDAKRLRQATQRLGLIEQHYFQHATPERGCLLDVGCSTGTFLRVARAAGWTVSGIDVSAGAVQYARTAHGLDAQVATLKTCDFPTQHFNLITLFDSLEHMPQPIEALRAAHRLLRDDGLLVITTPNIDGLFPRFTYRLFARTLGAWEHPTPPGHVYQFSRQTLRAALNKGGFTPLSCVTEAIPAAYTVGKLEEAIVSALKKEGSGNHGSVAPQNPKPETQNPKTSPLRRALRRGVRVICWGLTLTLSVPAPWWGQGDSMIVFACKNIH